MLMVTLCLLMAAGWLVKRHARKQLISHLNISFNKIDSFEVEMKLRRRPEFKAGLSVNYQPSEVLSFNANNLLDDSFEEAVGFSNMGQSFTVSITKGF